MNSGYKLKIRQQASSGEETSIRRIRTDYLDTLKRQSKQPLADNKKMTNNNVSNKTSKKITMIKSVAGKTNNIYTRLTTEAGERPAYQHHHRTATDKPSTSGNLKKPVSSTLGGSFKKRQTVNVKQVSCKLVASKPVQLGGKSTVCEKGENRYELEKKIGSGTFGTVHRARDKKTLDVVAIKKVYQDKNYKNRQLEILKMLNHPNVLYMKDSFFTYENNKQYLNVVMDHYEQNLYEAIKKYSRKSPMPRIRFKAYAYQLLRSLLYLKHIGIAHRDIKPQNVLVNEKTLKLVMCDFGSAKQLKPGEPNIAYICSRCYRAPQLIFGNTQYTTQIDMWSTGCVIAQMFLGTPIFQGQSNIDQLVEIIKILGCPTSDEVIEMNPVQEISLSKLPQINGKSWNKIFPGAAYLGQSFIDLMKNILCYSPSRRFTPAQALAHSFFDELRDQKVYRQLENQINIDSFFDFNKTCEASPAEIRKLIPQWY